VPDPELERALTVAVQRGVDVTLMTAGRQNNLRIARLGSRATYGRLLDAGIRLYEYDSVMLHAKSLLVDDAWAMIGSANLDACSLRFNLEAGIASCDPTFVGTVAESFGLDLADASEVRASDWHRRPLLARVAECAVRPLRGML
jgi:cardiolipin synthase